MSRYRFSLVAVFLIAAGASQAHADDPLEGWRSGVQIGPVSPTTQGHTIHAYFNTCPESPDSRQVLFFASAVPDAHHGDVVIRDRKTGEEKTLAKNIYVEDAHRVACQQWVSSGRRVVFHRERDGQWIVTAVDVDSGQARDLAFGRLSGWGQPHADIVPLYGPHWNPGPRRDLELLNVEIGEIRTALTVDAVKEEYSAWIAKSFGERPASIFFPVLSPDLKRVFFKMATPAGGDARSSKASERLGLVCYDLSAQRFLYQTTRWGHPAWAPDSKTIVEMSYTLYDSDTGKSRQLPALPKPRLDHPSMSPDGKLIVTDTTMDALGGDRNKLGIVVADARGGAFVVIHQFDNAGGASSWRRSHPHPVFSPDGRRIYFNVSSGRRTQLYVAERGDSSVSAKNTP